MFFVIHAACSFLLALLWHPEVFTYLRHEFVGKDTIFHLAVHEQLGLALLTLLLVVGLLWINLYKSRLLYRFASYAGSGKAIIFIALLADLLLTAILFLIAFTAAPQLLYFYYLLVFDYLPLQWVTDWPDFKQTLDIVVIKSNESLNTIMNGLSFWSLIAGVLLFWLYRYSENLKSTLKTAMALSILGVTSLCIIALT